MPLVFAENEETESGITYQDRTGVSYQYPRAYRRIIRSGERFVYYKGRRKRGGGRAPQVYFGVGLVGPTAPDPSRQDHFVCEILDYRAFLVAVPFRDPAGAYLESGGARRGYFQRGVRSISEQDFARILAAAQAGAEVGTVLDFPRGQGPLMPAYASPEKLRALEAFAVRVALDELRRRSSGSTPEPQPRNNPGFDILLRGSDPDLYVEVKGTERGAPLFFLTDGELEFSKHNPDRFRLIVVYDIQIDQGTYKVYWHEGAISSEGGFRLRPVQWACSVSDLARDR